MTKKDYIAIAKAIKTAYSRPGIESALQFQNALLAELSIVFAKDNPNFNAQRFYDAVQK